MMPSATLFSFATAVKNLRAEDGDITIGDRIESLAQLLDAQRRDNSNGYYHDVAGTQDRIKKLKQRAENTGVDAPLKPIWLDAAAQKIATEISADAHVTRVSHQPHCITWDICYWGDRHISLTLRWESRDIESASFHTGVRWQNGQGPAWAWQAYH